MARQARAQLVSLRSARVDKVVLPDFGFVGIGAGVETADLCVVVVESDPDAAEALYEALSEFGEIELCGDVESAAERCQELSPAAVLAELPPGGEDAEALLATLRSGDPSIEVLLGARDPTVQLRLKAIEAGAFDVLQRPYRDLSLVAQRVAQAQDKAVATRQAEGGWGAPEGELDLNQLSGLDPVTGLPDAGGAERRFEEEFARALRYDRPLSIAWAHVDALDQLAERRGQPLADATLRAIVSVMRGMIRNVDFLARVGPAQLLLLFPETEKAAAVTVVERLRAKLSAASAQDAEAGGASFRVSCSFGVAGLPDDTLNADRLQAAARAAMKHASVTMDLVSEYDPEMRP